MSALRDAFFTSDGRLDIPIVPESAAEYQPLTDETESEAPRKRGGGPKTEEGKKASRRNSTRHGMPAKVLLPDDLEEARQTRVAELEHEFAPTNPYETWLVGRLAFASVQLDRCTEMGIEDMRRAIHRAAKCWDDDRRREADALGAKLSKNPERVARGLRGSKQGADWLIERWEGLGQVLKVNGCWDDDQRSLAFDLLGVPRNLRAGEFAVPAGTDKNALQALVKRQVERLHADQEAALNDLDAHEREMALWGMPLTEDTPTKRLRKYETAVRKDWNWAHSELLRVRAERESREVSRLADMVPTRPFFMQAEPPQSGVPQAGVDYVVRRAQQHADLMAQEALARMRAAEAELENLGDDDDERADALLETILAAAEICAPPAPPVYAAEPEKPAGNRRQRRAETLRARREARKAKAAGTTQTPGC